METTTASALNCLQHIFGYTAFRGEQEAIIRHLAAGQDAVVIMPTGGGKSLCFQIPALMRMGTAVVISPLIALMHDQVSALREVGVAAACLHSALSSEQMRDVGRKLDRGELDLLYVAPERLLSARLLAQLDACFQRQQLALFAIDEAHCVSEWGHDFRPEYLQLSMLSQRFAGVPRIALTATADPQTRGEIMKRLDLNQARCFESSFDRPNIHYAMVDKNRPRAQLLAFLAEGHSRETGIVYCLSRRKVDETAQWLSKQGFTALPYHAGLAAEQRQANQTRFLFEDAIIMVATIAFGMGIDKPDVRFVAHLDLPRSIEAYYQETGRAGRDGLPAQAWMLWGAQDVVLQRHMIDESVAEESHKARARARLEALVDLVETTSCRRQHLLHHFGEILPSDWRCGNCDNCQHPPQLRDATAEARKALSAVFRTGQSSGAAHLIDVLRGEKTEKVLLRGHERVSTFGIGQDVDKQTWRMLFRQLVSRGLLAVDDERYRVLHLTEQARPLLRGEAVFELRQPPVKTRPRATSRRSRLEIANGVAQTVFDRLRHWRTQTAKQRQVPSYVIFNDATLRDIAISLPSSLDELKKINGIGDHKLQAYGSDILAIVGAPAL